MTDQKVGITRLGGAQNSFLFIIQRELKRRRWGMYSELMIRVSSQSLCQVVGSNADSTTGSDPEHARHVACFKILQGLNKVLLRLSYSITRTHGRYEPPA